MPGRQRKWPVTRRSLIQRAALVAVAAACLTALTACSGPGGSVSDQPAMGAIVLAGNTTNSTLILDKLLTFRITGGDKPLRFKVRPGLHHVQIEKDGATVVDRHVTVAAGQTLEITVP